MQVPARLYVFDVVTHTWKERGRGEVRLNDAAQSEGLFQSRLGRYMWKYLGSPGLMVGTCLGSPGLMVGTCLGSPGLMVGTCLVSNIIYGIKIFVGNYY